MLALLIELCALDLLLCIKHQAFSFHLGKRVKPNLSWERKINQNEIRGMMRNMLQACPSLELKGTWEDSLVGEIGWPLTLTLIVFVLSF